MWKKLRLHIAWIIADVRDIFSLDCHKEDIAEIRAKVKKEIEETLDE